MSHSFAKGFSLKKREMIKNRQFTKLKWKKWGKKGFYLLKPLIKCKNAEIIFVMTVQEGELTLYGLLALVCLNNPSAVPIQLVLTFLRLGGTSAQNVVRDSAPLSKKLRLLLLQSSRSERSSFNREFGLDFANVLSALNCLLLQPTQCTLKCQQIVKL